MTTVPDRDPQDHAVLIVAAAIEILRSRDGLPLTDEQIHERARNAVTALGSEFHLVPRSPGLDLLRAALADMRAASASFRVLGDAEIATPAVSR